MSGIVVGLALVLIARFDPQGFGLLRAGATDATTPASGVGRALVRGIGSIGSDVTAYLDAANQNRALRAELARDDRIALTNARALVHENRRLTRLVRLAQNEPATVVATRIVASSAMSVRRTATIEAGSLSGVRTGQPVRAPEGLIGRVLEVGQISARVALLTDGGNTIPVRLARGGAPALTVGTGEGLLDVRGLAAGANPFRRGDLLVTSGTGGVYPPNVPVAVVTRVSGDRAVALPAADPARIDFALVLQSAPALPPGAPGGRAVSLLPVSLAPRTLPARALIVPIASTLLGSALAALPLIASAPILPPCGLLMALSWRLLRSELWPAWVAVPLGAADDLLTGAPLGSGMVLWTICFLVVDMMDNRLIWRDLWQDWLIAAAALAFCLTGGWLFVRIGGGGGSILLIVPQLLIAIFCAPMAARLCALLDRWRLDR